MGQILGKVEAGPGSQRGKGAAAPGSTARKEDLVKGKPSRKDKGAAGKLSEKMASASCPDGQMPKEQLCLRFTERAEGAENTS